MYDLVYYFIFSLAKKKNPDPVFYSAGVVFFAQICHFGFITVITGKVFSANLHLRFSNDYVLNKLLLLPFAFLWLIVVYYYYKRKHPDIESKFSTKKVVTLKNGVIGFSIIFIPLIMAILLSVK